MKDSVAAFEASLECLKKAGFQINSEVSQAEIFDRWKDVLVYHPDALDALYITLGDQTNNRPYLNHSNSCWHFDLEAIESNGSYVRILENLSPISNGDLGFKNCSDYCNENEDNKVWVAFQFEGDNYKWNLKVDNGWADGYLFDKIQDLCKKYNKKGRLTFFPEGQAFVICYLTQEEFKNIKKKTGLKIEFAKLSQKHISADLVAIRDSLSKLEVDAKEHAKTLDPFSFPEFDLGYIRPKKLFKKRKLKAVPTLQQDDGNFNYEPYLKRFPILMEQHPTLDSISVVYVSTIKSLIREGRIGSALTYHNSYYQIKKFRGNCPFKKITVSYLREFENSLRSKGRSKGYVGKIIFLMEPILQYENRRQLYQPLVNQFGFHPDIGQKEI